MSKLGRPSNKKRTPFGERLSKARKQANISQKKLGEMMLVSQQVVGAWERKATSVNGETLKKLSEVLSVTTDYLLGIEDIKVSALPKGKMWELFQEASTLPRRQQTKIMEVVSALLVAQKMEP